MSELETKIDDGQTEEVIDADAEVTDVAVIEAESDPKAEEPVAEEPVAEKKKFDIKKLIPFAALLVIVIIGIVFMSANSGPDFKAVYDDYCSWPWATYANDGSYLRIDTNPDDEDDYSMYTALLAVPKVNEALGLPELVYERMLDTTSLQGVQSYDGDKISVSWTYHPDNGLEVMYYKK